MASVRQLAVVSLVFFMIEPGPAFASQTAFWEHPGDVRDRPVFLGYLAATRMVPTPRPTSIGAGVGLEAASVVLAAAGWSASPRRCPEAPAGWCEACPTGRASNGC